jgi:hypothetical protein
MASIEWEEIPQDLSCYLRRAKVPGGWLVIATEDVVHNTEYLGMIGGWDWRTSICFVPDSGHEWKLTKDGEAGE